MRKRTRYDNCCYRRGHKCEGVLGAGGTPKCGICCRGLTGGGGGGGGRTVTRRMFVGARDCGVWNGRQVAVMIYVYDNLKLICVEQLKLISSSHLFG